MLSSKEENFKLEEFEAKNQKFLENPLIQNFISTNENFLKYKKAICYPCKENKDILDKAFKLFYFNIRFTSFISSSLYFHAINYDKKQRLHSSRYVLTLDKPNEEFEQSFKETIPDPQSDISKRMYESFESIEDLLINPILIEAIQRLTKKQKEVINYVYVKGYSDTEIAHELGKSQQAVSKMHKSALSKIREFLKDKGVERL